MKKYNVNIKKADKKNITGMNKSKSSVESFSSKLSTIPLRIFLVLWSLIIILPLFWMIYTSVKERSEFIADRFALPKNIWIVNYFTAWNGTDSSLFRYFVNTFIIVAISTILLLVMVSGTSYVLAKYKFKMAKIFENFYFIAMMIPAVLVLIPLYYQLQGTGRTLFGSPSALTDNIIVLSIIYAVQALPVYIFLLVGFIRKIDNGFIEAAVMDGATEWTIFSKVIIPFVKPILMFIGLGNIMNVWNEYTMAVTFLQSENHYTISVGVQKLQNMLSNSKDFGALFASLVFSMIPILILYIIFQKQIQNGTDMNDGIK